MRYFLEVCYRGDGLAGFQVQENAMTVQGELERALRVFFRRDCDLTGSSRTDTGVHALQNFFHIDVAEEIPEAALYNLNALLPDGIALKSIRRVGDQAHCRFDAVGRQYCYTVYRSKDPFLRERGFYFPYAIDLSLMGEAAALVSGYHDFRAFAKRNSQAKTFDCKILLSRWERVENDVLLYRVAANRFLRGMVRGLVGTMLQVGRGKMSVERFQEVIEQGDPSKVDFSVPGHGLLLEKVMFPDHYFE